MKNARQKYRMYMTLFIVGGLSCLVLAVKVSAIWSAALFGIFAISAFGLMALTCENGHSVLYRKEIILGMSIETWWPTLPQQCPICQKKI